MSGATQTRQLYERLRAAVLRLDLAPGERLTERGVEGAFGASRTPARAALERLAAEGLVQRIGRGWIVAPIDLAELARLAELREAVECAAVRLAVRRADPEAIGAVEALLDAHTPRDADEGVWSGRNFHVRLAGLSANPVLADTVDGAMIRLERTRWLAVTTADARTQAWSEHRAVLGAIAEGDAERAAALIGSHIRGTHERLVAQLTEHHRRLRGGGMAIING